MTVENGAAEAANDTAVSTEDQANAAPSAEEEAGKTADDGEQDAEQNEDEEEIDLGDGEKYRIPRKLREAIAKPMLGDYTRKTQELSDQRKSFEGEREAFSKSTAAQRAHFEEAAKVIALNDQIKEADDAIAKYANLDWLTLGQTNPEQYQQHRAYYDSLRDRKAALADKRDSAARTWTEKEQEYATNSNRERGERVAKAKAEIAKHVEGWAPGNDLDLQLGKYGNSVGLTNDVMAELAIQAPVLVKLLNEHRTFSEAAAKQKQQQTFEQSQQAKPVKRVSGGGSGNTLRTTDPSGDKLTTEEWAKREAERLRKR